MDGDTTIIAKIVANIRFINQKIKSLAKDIASVKAEQRIINRNLDEIKARLDRLENGQ